jgi:hypothetical protein
MMKTPEILPASFFPKRWWIRHSVFSFVAVLNPSVFSFPDVRAVEPASRLTSQQK